MSSLSPTRALTNTEIVEFFFFASFRSAVGTQDATAHNVHCNNKIGNAAQTKGEKNELRNRDEAAAHANEKAANIFQFTEEKKKQNFSPVLICVTPTINLQFNSGNKKVRDNDLNLKSHNKSRCRREKKSQAKHFLNKKMI